MPLLIYPIFPAMLIGTLNWLYWRKRGYTSKVQLVMNIFLFYAIFYSLLKIFI